MGAILLGAFRSVLGALAAMAVLVLAAALPSDAHADAVDDLAKVLDIAGTALPTIPVKGQDVRDSRSLFKCIDGAGDDLAVAKCLDTFKDTSVGQKAWQQGGLPSWFLKLIDIYIDVREGDFWELVADVGIAVACAVANGVFAVDVCGIAAAIIETIDDVAEAFSDAWEFIEDVGSAVADFLGLGGGSDGPPLWAVLYKKKLQPYIPNYAHDWLTDRPGFVAAFDVTGKQPKSLLCTISQSYFKKSCAWLFAPPAGSEQYYKAWYRDSLVHAVNMANAAATTQGIATVGISAAKWREFRNDWTIYRSQADRLRRGYAVTSEPAMRLQCGAAAEPWRVFLDSVKNPAVAADANKVLAKSSTVWNYGETAQSFCTGYAVAIKPEKIKSCEVSGKASASLLPLECADYQWVASCKSAAASGYVTSAKFPPALQVTCGVNETMADVDLGKDLVAQLGKNAQGQMACELGETLSANPPAHHLAKPVIGGPGKPAQKQTPPQLSQPPKNPMLAVVCHRDLKKARCDTLLADAKKKFPKTGVSCSLKYTPQYAALVATVKQKVIGFNPPPASVAWQPGQAAPPPASSKPKFEIENLDPLRVSLVAPPGASPPKLEQHPQAKAVAQVLSTQENDCLDPEFDGVEKPALCPKSHSNEVTKPELTDPVARQPKFDPSSPVASGTTGAISPAQGNVAVARPGLSAQPGPPEVSGQQQMMSGSLPSKSGSPGTASTPSGRTALPAVQQPAPAATGRTALPAVQRPTAPAGVDAALKAAGCTRRGDATAFSCTSRAGFDRCESLRQQRKVVSCALAGRG